MAGKNIHKRLGTLLTISTVLIILLIVLFIVMLLSFSVTTMQLDPQILLILGAGGALLAIIQLIVLIVIVHSLKKNVEEPLKEIVENFDLLRQGRPEAASDYISDDEIGMIAETQRQLIDRMSEDIGYYHQLLDGDYSQDLPTPKSGKDSEGLGNTIQGVIDKTRDLIRNLRIVGEQIKSASNEIASGSQNLASGSNEQASAIEEFTATVESITLMAKENSESALDAASSMQQYAALVRSIGDDMRKMTKTMSDITDSAHRISSVSDIVEGIAFQTNILALNAAVEAARAGQQGKGFAVVADEVRDLSAKSSAAARETAELIKEDLETVEIGNKIAEGASKGMIEIEKVVEESANRLAELGKASENQSASMDAINQSINQISQIVQANSALAEESAAAATQLQTQSSQLDLLVQEFKIDK